MYAIRSYYASLLLISGWAEKGIVSPYLLIAALVLVLMVSSSSQCTATRVGANLKIFSRVSGRITSYNVCYTKLLRNFSIDKDEILYGGGARVLGMNRRGNRLQLYNRAHYGYETHSPLMNYTLPLFLSSKQYAVLSYNFV